jgi:hypothetical protein
MKIAPLSSTSCLAVFTLALTAGAQSATILGGSGQSNNATIPADHGSRLLGTPNLVLAWSADWDAYTSRTTSDYTPFATWPNDAQASGVYQLDAALNVTQTIAFTPDTGFAVILSSLDLNDWVQGPSDLAGMDVDWVVSGPLSGTLGSGTFATVDGTSRNFTLGGLTGADGETLTLGLTQRSGSASYLAMDNLSFDQVAVPEPTGAALGVLALGAMAMRRRRA